MKKASFKILLTTLLLASLPGCSLQRPVARHAVDYNRAVEQAYNQTVLLNAVRSMKRHAQHYTAITDVRGTASNSLRPSLSLTLKNGALTPWAPSGGATRTDQALVTVSVLDDQEFVQGILSPISLSQLDYFMKQGWPERLVEMLFVRQIDILHDDFRHPDCKSQQERESKGLTSYRNEPNELAADPFQELKCFEVRLAHLRVEEKLRIEDKVTRSLDFELSTTQQDHLAGLILQANSAGVKIEKVGEDEQGRDVTYRISKSTSSKVLRWGRDEEAVTYDADMIQEFEESVTDEENLDKKEEKKKRVRIYFRSAQSAVYYLGEIMRAQAVMGFSTDTPFQDLEPKITSRHDENKEMLLFGAWKSGPHDKKPLSSVKYDGETYVIPRLPDCATEQASGCHRSMQTLAIIKQLIGLNKKRKSLSTTSVVTAIGLGE